MRYTFLVVLTLVASAVNTSFAQERTASGAAETQMTWTALKNSIDQVKIQAQAATILSEAIKTCGIRGMLYSPGVGGSDGQGCRAATTGNQGAHWDRNHGYAWAGQVLMQWGIACPPSGGSVYVNLPVGFPHGIMSTTALINEPHYGATRANQFIRAINNNTIEIGKAGMNGCMNWLATGY